MATDDDDNGATGPLPRVETAPAWTPEVEDRLRAEAAPRGGIHAETAVVDRADLAAALAELDLRGADVVRLRGSSNTALTMVRARGAELQKRGEERERMFNRIAELEQALRDAEEEMSRLRGRQLGLAQSRARIAEIEQALRKVPIVRTRADHLGYDCPGCGATSGMTAACVDLQEACEPGCWVPGVESALQFLGSEHEATPNHRFGSNTDRYLPDEDPAGWEDRVREAVDRQVVIGPGGRVTSEDLDAADRVTITDAGRDALTADGDVGE